LQGFRGGWWRLRTSPDVASLIYLAEADVAMARLRENFSSTSSFFRKIDDKETFP